MPDTEEIGKLDNEIQNLSKQSRILNQVMKKGYMDSALFMESNSQQAQRLTECRRKRALLARKQKRTKETVCTQQFIALLAEQKKPLKEYDEKLFDLTVKEIRISKEHDITFCLYNGLQLTEREGRDADAVHMPIGYKVVNGRMLENHNYFGTEYYPQIIERELFDRVQERREQVRAEKGRG